MSSTLRADDSLDNFLVLATGVRGADGLSTLSRLVLRALRAHPGVGELACWSLGDETPCIVDGVEGVEIRGASGVKSRIAWWALRERPRLDGYRVLVMHAHLLPLALSLGKRDERLIPLLVGIEAWKPLGPLQRSALGRARYCLSISQHTLDRFVTNNPSFAALETRVCHPAVVDRPVDSFGQEPLDDSSLDGPFALIVARMSAAERYKGHDELLEIWARLNETVPEARLVVIGDGDDRARLEAKRDRLGLGERIRFLGAASDSVLERVYRRASLFVMPSRNEGFGLVFLEAMRAGLPVIAAPGAASEIIDDGKTGFLVDAGDRENMVDRLTRLFHDQKLRQSMGSSGSARFERVFAERCFRERFAQALALRAGVEVLSR